MRGQRGVGRERKGKRNLLDYNLVYERKWDGGRSHKLEGMAKGEGKRS